ncbi:hypothetical protein DRO59_03410 [Candidatus Bathyarchaeota archaeon]|nr:MAG: hypothetical protein DRO59_03410 [Candidatus Bathyarchaeota archaeon]
MRDAIEVFRGVLVRERQCQVEVVPPSVCHWDFYSIRAIETVQVVMLSSAVKKVICTLASMVPIGCQVWLKQVDISVLKDPGSSFCTVEARALLHTSEWVELSNTYPFLTAEEVMKLSLLSPGKRKLCILGRRVRKI